MDLARIDPNCFPASERDPVGRGDTFRFSIGQYGCGRRTPIYRHPPPYPSNGFAPWFAWQYHPTLWMALVLTALLLAASAST